MPAAIPAVLTAAGAYIGGASVLAAVGYGALTLAGSFLMKAIAPKPPSFKDPGYEVNTNGSSKPHAWVYGRTKVGGVVVLDAASGEANKYFHRVIVLAGHEIESVDRVYADQEPLTLDANGMVTEGPYEGKLRVKIHLGSPNQAADSDLVSELSIWTSAHRLRGRAYLYCRFEYDREVFTRGAPPVMTAIVKGRKVGDPRDSSADAAYSNNSASCLLDFLQSHPEIKVDDDEIDYPDAAAAYSLCDEDVQYRQDGGNLARQKRYVFNTSFLISAPPVDAIDLMRASMAGIYWYGDGSHHFRPGAFRTPVMSLSTQDLRSGMQVLTEIPARERYNSVGGTYSGPETQYQTTDYPEFSSDTWKQQDGGRESRLDVDLPYVDNSARAQRVSQIALRRTRQMDSFSADFNLKAMLLEPGDVIRFTHERLGWRNKIFEVLDVRLENMAELRVGLDLKGTASSVYAWNPGSQKLVNEVKNAPTVGGGPVLTMTWSYSSGTLRITLSADAPVENIEIETRRSNQSPAATWDRRINAPVTGHVFGSVGTYSIDITASQGQGFDVRARGEGSSRLGPWETLTNIILVATNPKGGGPVDNSGSSGTGSASNIRIVSRTETSVSLSWSGSGTYYDVYYSTTNSRASATLAGRVYSRSTTISGLEAGSLYYIWVCPFAPTPAKSGGGSPQAGTCVSTNVQLNSESAPSVPRSVAITSSEVTWNVPSSTGGGITGYGIEIEEKWLEMVTKGTAPRSHDSEGSATPTERSFDWTPQSIGRAGNNHEARARVGAFNASGQTWSNWTAWISI